MVIQRAVIGMIVFIAAVTAPAQAIAIAPIRIPFHITAKKLGSILMPYSACKTHSQKQNLNVPAQAPKSKPAKISPQPHLFGVPELAHNAVPVFRGQGLGSLLQPLSRYGG